jgi:hypothetical protein
MKLAICKGEDEDYEEEVITVVWVSECMCASVL